MAPWNTTTSEPSPVPSNTHVLASQPEARNHFEGRTITGIIFALACFAVITCVFLSSRHRRDTLCNRNWFDKLKRMASCLRSRPEPSNSPRNTENTLPRQSTFPPPASRASTFDQHLPPYSRHDPQPVASGSHSISTIGETGESRSVTPS
jgi:hypothetical protein